MEMEMDMQWAFTVLPKPTGHKRPCILFPNRTGNRSGLHIQTMAHHTIVNHLLFFIPEMFLPAKFWNAVNGPMVSGQNIILRK